MNGKYEFLKLPFGLQNAFVIFLKLYVGKICYVYINDIIKFGKDEEENLSNMDIIFGRLSEAKLKVKLEKIKLIKNNEEFLGYIITPEGIKPDMKEVNAIRNMMPDENLKEFKSFLGMTPFNRKYI